MCLAVAKIDVLLELKQLLEPFGITHFLHCWVREHI